MLSLLKSVLLAVVPIAAFAGDKYPNKPRKARLEEYFGFEIGELLSRDEYEEYTQEPNALVETWGVNSLHPNPASAAYRNIRIQADEGGAVDNVKMTFEEFKLICASLCDKDSKCKAVDVTDRNSGFSCSLLDPSDGPGNAVSQADCGCDLADVAPNAVLYKGVTNPFQANVCDIPRNITAAVACLPDPGLPDCNELLTDDFQDYIVPAIGCVAQALGDPAAVEPCLTCISSSLNGLCIDMAAEICSEDKDTNTVQKPCIYTEGIGSTELPEICGALKSCGDFCPEECLPEIQTASLCAIGVAGIGCITKDVDGAEDYKCKV